MDAPLLSPTPPGAQAFLRYPRRYARHSASVSPAATVVEPRACAQASIAAPSGTRSMPPEPACTESLQEWGYGNAVVLTHAMASRRFMATCRATRRTFNRRSRFAGQVRLRRHYGARAGRMCITSIACNGAQESGEVTVLKQPVPGAYGGLQANGALLARSTRRPLRPPVAGARRHRRSRRPLEKEDGKMGQSP